MTTKDHDFLVGYTDILFDNSHQQKKSSAAKKRYAGKYK